VTLVDGVKKMRGFLEANGISKRKASRDLKVSLPTVIDWLRARKSPTPAHRRAIEIWTNGKVREADWESAKERRAAAKAEVVKPFESADAGGGVQ
jgi:hypothetical protein